MPQADGYVRIVTQNDTSEARRSTEQLGDAIRDSLDTTPADRMARALGGVQDGVEETGNAALKTGDIIKANLISEVVTQGLQQLGEALKNAAVHTIEVADGLNSSVNKIAAATNASSEDTERLKGVVEQIYSDNFGESFDNIADSVAKIKQNLGDLDDKSLVNVTESAYALQDVFGYAVDESSRAARAIVQNFNVSAAEAYDYIARGAQNGLDFSGELLDSISEYSVHFKKLGLSLDDMFNIMQKGADSGAFKLDSIGDAIKEVSISAVDGSDTTKHAFEAVGLSADKMAEMFSKGGESASEAFYMTIQALAEMDDLQEQETAGVELFKTLWEDLSKGVVLAMSDISDSAYDCAGAMDGIKDVNYDDLSNSVDTLKRQIDLLIQPIGESLIPILDEAADTVTELAQEGDIKEIAVGVGNFISGTLTLLLKNLKLILSAVSGITAAVIAFKTANRLISVIQSWQTAALQVNLFAKSQGTAALQTAATTGQLTLQEVVYGVLSGKISIATARTAAFNAVLNMNPAGAIVAVIGILATAITGFSLSAQNAASETSELAEKANKLTDSVQNMNDSIDDSISKNESEMSMLKSKADRYDELRKAVNLTADEEAELKGLALDLQNVLGDNVSAINSLTGEYNDLTTAVDNYIKKQSTMVKLSAYENAAKNAYIVVDESQKIVDELEAKYGEDKLQLILAGLEARKELANNVEDVFGYNPYGSEDSSDEQTADVRAWEKALKDIKDAQSTIDTYNKLLKESFVDGYSSEGSSGSASKSITSPGNSAANYLPDYWKDKSEDFKYWKNAYNFDYDNKENKS